MQSTLSKYIKKRGGEITWHELLALGRAGACEVLALVDAAPTKAMEPITPWASKIARSSISARLVPDGLSKISIAFSTKLEAI